MTLPDVRVSLSSFEYFHHSFFESGNLTHLLTMGSAQAPPSARSSKVSGKAACYQATGIQPLEYKSKCSRGVIKIKNSRPRVDQSMCRQTQCDTQLHDFHKKHLCLERFPLIFSEPSHRGKIKVVSFRLTRVAIDGVCVSPL